MATLISAVAAGLVPGVVLIILLYVGLNARISHLDYDLRPEETPLMTKARQQEATHLFMRQHLFAHEGIVNRGPIVYHDEVGNAINSTSVITVAYYAPYPRTSIRYDVEPNQSLIEYKRPRLAVTVDFEGNVREIMYGCGISYLGGFSSVGTAVSGDELVLKYLRAGKIPC